MMRKRWEDSAPERRASARRKWAAVCGLALIALGSACRGGGGAAGGEWEVGDFRLAVDGRGCIAAMADRRTGADYLVSEVESPLLALRVDGRMLSPSSFRPGRRSTALLGYPGGLKARVRIEAKPTHIAIELLSISPRGRAEVAVWGPFATTIDETIGETVGVVRGRDFALGIQALNPKTLGGYPWSENDCMPQMDIFEQGDYSDLSEAGKREVLYRVEAARPTAFGSALQAYCRDRGDDRVIANWDHDRYAAPRFEDGGLSGSKIALFGCPVEQTLETLEWIELAEDLPHPTIDGVWGKISPGATAAYLILDFGEADIDRALDAVERAGLRYLYHPEPFRTWGHFILDETKFPNGVEGLWRCVEKAEARGIHVGVHMLSNFITTNDRYVTPVPDSRLAKVGASVLAEDADAAAIAIVVESPGFFNQHRNDTLRTAVVGEELVRYRAVSDEPPWTLLDCERGAFGTRAAAHRRGEAIAKLADHAYKVFLTDADLGREVARRMADLFNAAGLRQISFDGLEGNRSTGMGNYGEILFTTAWYERLSPEIRGHYIADASRTSHYFWHVYSRMNWGEPWYGGFRESQTEYRLKNQAYFRRNLMPGMLGWFQMRPETTLEDVEWLLALAAALDAGFGFVTSFGTLDANGAADEIFAAIRAWEGARRSKAFSDEQKRRIESVRAQFGLD